MTYEQWRQQAAKRGDLNTESAWNAAIAARDEELRKQEPVGYIKYSIGELPRFEPVIFSKCKVEGYIADWKACYSAPIPPTPSQRFALDCLDEYSSDREWGETYVKTIRDFILARPDAPIPPTVCAQCKGNPDLCDIHDCGDAHKATPIPPEPTPSQQEALRICDGFRVLAGQTNDADKLKHFILARPDAPIPPDNHDWKAEYLRQVDLLDFNDWEYSRE